MNKTLISIFLVCFGVTCIWAGHSFTIMDGFTCEPTEENHVYTTTDDVSDIMSHIPAPVERASSIRTGTWITYFRHNFLGDGYVNRDNCETYTSGTGALTSFRRVGDLDDPNRPSVTFYVNSSYAGAPKIFYQNNPIILDNFNSLIVVGDEPITLYTQIYYGDKADAICLTPYAAGYSTVSSTKYLWCDYMNPFCFEQKVRSFQYGCDPEAGRILKMVN